MPKTIQAAAHVARSQGGTLSRLRLLKILYIADRECLREHGHTITGDHPYAMENGPVLTETYDLIKGRHGEVAEWDAHFGAFGVEVDVTGKRHPGVGLLSRREMAKLDEVAKRYEDVDDFELSMITHDFLEWAKTYPKRGPKKSVAIPPALLLEAVGRSGDQARLASEAGEDAAMAALLASARRARIAVHDAPLASAPTQDSAPTSRRRRRTVKAR